MSSINAKRGSAHKAGTQYLKILIHLVRPLRSNIGASLSNPGAVEVHRQNPLHAQFWRCICEDFPGCVPAGETFDFLFRRRLRRRIAMPLAGRLEDDLQTRTVSSLEAKANTRSAHHLQSPQNLKLFIVSVQFRVLALVLVARHVDIASASRKGWVQRRVEKGRHFWKRNIDSEC